MYLKLSKPARQLLPEGAAHYDAQLRNNLIGYCCCRRTESVRFEVQLRSLAKLFPDHGDAALFVKKDPDGWCT
jgi:hypothetical protein